jgi:hypothetical protein
VAGDVYVTFGADTGPLEAAFALAKAETNALSREMRDLAAEMAKAGAGMDSELGQRLNAVGAQMAAAKANMGALRAEMSGGAAAAEVGLLAGFKEQVEGALGPVRALLSFLPAIGEAIAAAFAVEKVKEFVESMAELGLETERAAAILGEPTESIGALRMMAEASGLSLDQLEMSFARLSRNLAEQAPAAKRALDALGLSFKDLAGKSAEQQLGTFADAFSKIADGSTKAAIAQELFGRAGMQMIPMLDQGSGAIAHWAQVAEDTGVALKENVVARMEETHGALIDLGAAMQGTGIAVFSEFSGVINGAVQYVANLAKEFTHAANENGVVKAALDDLRITLQVTESTIVGITTLFQLFWETASMAVDQAANSFKGLGTVVADVFRALAAGIGNFFSGMMTAARAATSVVGQEFADLGDVIAGAFTGQAGAAWAKMKTDAASAGDAIKTAFSGAVAGFDFSKITADTAAAQAASDKIMEAWKTDTTRILAEGQQEIDTIWSQGHKQVEAKEEQHQATMAALRNAGADKAARDALRAAMEELDGEAKAAQSAATSKEKILAGELQRHEISTQQWLQQTRDALQDELQDEMAAYQQELGLANLTASQKQQILNKMQAAQERYDQQIVAAEQKAADDTMRQWQSVAQTIEGAFNSQLRGLLAGTTSWAQAMKNIAGDLTIKFIEEAEKMVVNWVIGEATKTAATQAGAVARTAAGAGEASAGIAQDAMAAIKSILTSAAETFAGVFGFLAPVMGPAAAGPAMAAQATVMSAAGAVASADIGMWSVPSDQLAMIHKNELIMPAAQAGAFRDMLSAGGGGQGGVEMHFHYNPQIHATDQTGIASILAHHGAAFAREVADQYNRNPSLRPAY